MRLTTAAIEGLKLDAGVADKIVFDDDVPGFGIRVRASGARTWIYQYKIGGRTRRLVLGQVSALRRPATLPANSTRRCSLDPLITLHGVPESNPVMMRGVMDIFRDMAASLNCSTEVVGHTRKPPIGFDGELTAYDTRGSGAIVDALRSVRMLNLMTSSEAEEAGVQEYERERHVRVTPAKRNYSATAAPPNWIKIENLLISNGDDVGVVIPWTWPGHDPAAFEAAVRRAEGIFIEVATRLIKRGHRLSDKGGRVTAWQPGASIMGFSNTGKNINRGECAEAHTQ